MRNFLDADIESHNVTFVDGLFRYIDSLVIYQNILLDSDV